MWVFITARIRQWLLLAIAVPVLTMLVRLVRTWIEKRSGETRLTRALGRVEQFGQRHRRGVRRRR
jgi:hypothetical protein